MGRDFRQGRGSGRGGRGFGKRRSSSFQSNRNSNNGNKPSKKKSLSDYVFTLGSTEQANDYDITMEFMINYIMKTYDKGVNIGKAIKTEVQPDFKTWKPSIGVFSSSAEGDAKVAEEKQIKLAYKEEYNAYSQRKTTYEDNLIKFYALLWKRCSKSMQIKISSRSDFMSNIKYDPIKLKIAIREHALNFQENRYYMAVIYDSIKTVFNCKQKEGETITDFVHRFKTARDVFTSQLGGPIIMTAAIKKMSEYDKSDESNIDQLAQQEWDKFMAYTVMVNTDQTKYGSIIKKLNMDQSLKDNKWPKSIAAATNALSEHPFDNAYKNKVKKNKNSRNDSKKTSDNKEKDDEGDDVPPLSFSQSEQRCYKCRKKDHISPDCKRDDIVKKEDWYINKVRCAEGQVHTHFAGSQDEPKLLEPSSSTTFRSQVGSGHTQVSSGWVGAHIPHIEELALQF